MQKRRPSRDAVFHVILSEVEGSIISCQTLATLFFKMMFGRVEKMLERLYIIWAKTCTFLRGCL